MTKTLQILFIFVLGIIVLLWFADLFLAIPVDIADQSLTTNNAENYEGIKNEHVSRSLLTLIYILPTVVLLFLTIKSIREKNKRLFYWTFLIGLTLFQIIPTLGLFNVSKSAPSFFRPILALLWLILLMGQIASIYKIFKNNKSFNNKLS